MIDFASDNYAGAHPAVLEALARANAGRQPSYGADEWTRRAVERARSLFGAEAEVFFVLNGTAANVLTLQTMTKPYNAIICARQAHINNDECGAPERFTGCKLITVDCPDGKLTVPQLEPFVAKGRDEHNVQPKALALSQPTELGAVYTPAELTTLTDFAHRHNLYVYVDGARFANAVAALDIDPQAAARDCGVDALSIGGAKNGLLYGECVIFYNRALARDFKYIRKQGMQLISKMRFVAAQFDALLTDDLWLKSARHANQMARELERRVSKAPQVKIVQKTQTNSVFAQIDKRAIAPLQAESHFYVWDEARSVARWMTAFDTQLTDVEDFARRVKAITEGLS